MTYCLRTTGQTWAVWRSDGTAIVYRDRCQRTAAAVCRDLNRSNHA